MVALGPVGRRAERLEKCDTQRNFIGFRDLIFLTHVCLIFELLMDVVGSLRWFAMGFGIINSCNINKDFNLIKRGLFG